MRPIRTLNALSAAVLGLGLLAPAARAQQPAAPAPARPAAEDRPAGDLPGPIDSLQDVQDAGKMVFKMADTDNNGQISQREATDFGNLIVGGFFFRADANGDGKVSAEEARQAREALLQQKPLLRFALSRVQNQNQNQNANARGGEGAAGTAGNNPLQALANVIDVNNDKQLEATELRQAVQTTVQALYAAADTNRDGQMSPAEVNGAVIGLAHAAAQAAFQAADRDRNGSLSREEFVQSLTAPAESVFAILDANGDGQLAPQELRRAQQIVAGQLRLLQVPEPPNSAGNMIRSGARPGGAAPIASPAPAPAPGTAPRP